MEKLIELAQQEDIKLNIIHQYQLKPYYIPISWKLALSTSKYGGLVTDDENVGLSSALS